MKTLPAKSKVFLSGKAEDENGRRCSRLQCDRFFAFGVKACIEKNSPCNVSGVALQN